MKVQHLLETPYLHDEELGYEVLSKISGAQLSRAYTFIGATANGLEIYARHTGGFIAGYRHGAEISQVISITSRKVAYPLEPPGLGQYEQVSMVNVSKEFSEEGHAREVYLQIAQKIPLVSDHEQYWAAKGLWKSLARSKDINVYVFDGVYRKYSGTNIRDAEIWGQSQLYKTVLLVATARELPDQT